MGPPAEPAEPRALRGPGVRTQITERDLGLLAFIAAHRLVRGDQVQRYLGASPAAARKRLGALERAGLIDQATVFHRRPACQYITRTGLRAIGSTLPVPDRNLQTFTHAIGVAWIWLAARDGAFGPLREIISERHLRSRDGPGRRSDTPLAVRIGGYGPHGAERLHYPDLRLVTAEGHRVAIELELTSKGQSRREGILAAYASDPGVDAVLYLVRERSVGTKVNGSARRVGASDRVHVQRVGLGDQSKPPARPGVAARTRSAKRPGARTQGFAR